MTSMAGAGGQGRAPSRLGLGRAGGAAWQRTIWLAAIGLFALSCAGFWLFSIWQDRAAALREVEQQTGSTARLLEEHAERAFEAGEHLLGLMTDMAASVDLRDPEVGRQVSERLQNSVAISPQIGSAWYLDARGDTLLNSWGVPFEHRNFAHLRYFQEHREGREDLVIGAADSGWFGGETRFTLSRGVRGEQGDFEGVAVVAVYTGYFEQFYQEAVLAPGSTIRLLTSDGAVLSSSTAGEAAACGGTMAMLADRLEAPSASRRLSEGEDDCVLVLRRLAALPVVVAASTPLSSALADWRSRTLRSGLAVLAALLGFGLVAGLGLRAVRREHLALVGLATANETLESRVRERTAKLERRESDLRLIADALPALLAYIGPDQRYRFVNRTYEEWFGRRRADIQGQTVRQLAGEEGWSMVADHVQAALAGERVFFQAAVPYPAGLRHVEAQYIPARDADGTSRGFYTFVTDVTERKRGEAAVRASEARYRALAEAIAVVIWTTTPDGDVVEMPQWCALTGQTAEQARGWGWLEALHPDERESARRAWRHALATATPYDLEYRVRTEAGHYRWYNGRGVPIRGEDGTIQEWIGVCIDIDERKTAEERQALLMAELDHRVRNILASIQSMVSLTARSVTTKQDYARALHGRVAAMARAHGLVTQQRWKGASLARIVRDELEPYAASSEAIVLDGEFDCILKPKEALNFALVMHELATNAAKYGALSVPDGRVTLSWRIEHGEGGPRLRTVWQESGGPPVEEPSRRGFGSTLIENVLGGASETAVRLEFDPSGVRCVIEMPVHRLLLEQPEAPDGPDASAPPKGKGARASLRAARILVVEDELLVGLEIQRFLSQAGVEVVGPAASLEEGMRLSDNLDLNAAVLDVNLGGETVEPLSDRLLARQVPILFVTGYDAQKVLPERLRHLPSVQKPVQAAVLLERLRRLVRRRGAAGAQANGRPT